MAQLSASSPDSATVYAYVEASREYWYVAPDTAYIFAAKGAELAKKTGFKRGYAKCVNAKGVTWYFRGNFQMALSCYFEVLRINEEIGDKRGLCSGKNNIGEVYRAQERNKEALKYYSEALVLAEEIKDSNFIAVCLNNAAIIYANSHTPKLAIANYERALEIQRKTGNQTGVASCYNNLGTAYKQLGNIKLSLDYFYQALALCGKLGDKQGICIGMVNIAGIEKDLGNAALSNEYAQKALGVAQQIGAVNEVRVSADILMENYRKLGKFELALHYNDIAEAAQDSLFSIEKEQAITAAQATYDLEKQQREIDLLNKDKTIRAQELARKSLARNILAITLVAALLLLALGTRTYFKIRKANRQLEAQRNDLDTLNRVKDKLFAIIGHDLRGPLASIKGFLSLMHTGALSPAEQEKIVKRLGLLTTNAMETLDNLLHWSVSQAHGMRRNPKRIDMRHAVDHQFSFFREIAESKEITLENDIPEGQVIWADRDQIHIVLRNLVANAIKFTGAGGAVTVSARVEGALLNLSMQDTGVGISAEQLSRLFHSSQNISTDGTAHEKGTGLGLLLCKEFIEANNGTITIQSQPGVGTTVALSLPLWEPGVPGTGNV